MTKKITMIMMAVIWIKLFILLIAEPDGASQYNYVPSWVGWVYILLLFGIPVALLNMTKDNNP